MNNKVVKYNPYAGDKNKTRASMIEYMAMVPCYLYLFEGRQYKDGTSQWLICGRPYQTSSKELPTLDTVRGSRDDAEKRMLELISDMQTRMMDEIANSKKWGTFIEELTVNKSKRKD